MKSNLEMKVIDRNTIIKLIYILDDIKVQLRGVETIERRADKHEIKDRGDVEALHNSS